MAFVYTGGSIAPKVHQVIQLSVPVEIRSLPASRESNRRDTLELECVASGNPVPTIEWSFNGVKFVNGKSFDDSENSEIRHTMKGEFFF